MVPIFLFLLISGDPLKKISEDTLDAAELSDIGYGFHRDNTIYLGYLSHLVAIDKDGQVSFTFSKKGSGPKEMKSGGPIFSLGDHVFCYDVMGAKLVQFSLNLSYEKDTGLKKYPLGEIQFLNDGSRLFSLVRYPQTQEIILETWNLESLQQMDAITISLELFFDSGAVTAQFIEPNLIVLMEKTQMEDHLILHTYHLPSGDLKTFKYPNPDFDKKGLKKSRRHPFLGALRHGATVSSISSDENHIYLFIEAYDENAKRTEVSGYRYFAIRKKGMTLVKHHEIPFISVSGFQNSPVQVMKNKDGEVIVAHAKHFLKNPK